MINHKRIGRQIRELRMLRGWKQYELAEKVGLSLNTKEPTYTSFFNNNWRDAYYSLDKDKKRAIWQHIIKEIRLDENRNFTIIFR